MSRGNHSASNSPSTAGNCNASGEGNQPAAWRRAFDEAVEANPSVAMPRGSHTPSPSAVGNGANAPAQGSQPPASRRTFIIPNRNIWRCSQCNMSFTMRPVNQATPSFPSSEGPDPFVEFLRRFLPPSDSNEGNPEHCTCSSPSPSAVENGPNTPAQGSQPPASRRTFIVPNRNIWRCSQCNMSFTLRPVNQATPSFPSSDGPDPVVEFLRRFLPPSDSNEGNPEHCTCSSLQGCSHSRLSS